MMILRPLPTLPTWKLMGEFDPSGAGEFGSPVDGVVANVGVEVPNVELPALNECAPATPGVGAVPKPWLDWRPRVLVEGAPEPPNVLALPKEGPPNMLELALPPALPAPNKDCCAGAPNTIDPPKAGAAVEPPLLLAGAPNGVAAGLNGEELPGWPKAAGVCVVAPKVLEPILPNMVLFDTGAEAPKSDPCVLEEGSPWPKTMGAPPAAAVPNAKGDALAPVTLVGSANAFDEGAPNREEPAPWAVALEGKLPKPGAPPNAGCCVAGAAGAPNKGVDAG